MGGPKTNIYNGCSHNGTEKVTTPLLKLQHEGILAVTQFAVKTGADCNIAKLRVLFMSKERN